MKKLKQLALFSLTGLILSLCASASEKSEEQADKLKRLSVIEDEMDHFYSEMDPVERYKKVQEIFYLSKDESHNEIKMKASKILANTFKEASPAAKKGFLDLAQKQTNQRRILNVLKEIARSEQIDEVDQILYETYANLYQENPDNRLELNPNALIEVAKRSNDSNYKEKVSKLIIEHLLTSDHQQVREFADRNLEVLHAKEVSDNKRGQAKNIRETSPDQKTSYRSSLNR